MSRKNEEDRVYNKIRFWIYDTDTYMVNIPYSFVNNSVKSFLGIKTKKQILDLPSSFVYTNGLVGKPVSVQIKIERDKFDDFMKDKSNGLSKNNFQKLTK